MPLLALFGDAVGLDDGGARGREVMKPPLCALCLVEIEVDGLSEEAVVQKGLRRVEVVDGGVTKKRWAMKDGQRRLKHSKQSPEVRSEPFTGVEMY